MELSAEIIKRLSSHENRDVAIGMEKYMRNKFSYYGLTSPERKLLVKPYIPNTRNLGLDDLFESIFSLWEDPFRESQYAAMDILIANKKRLRKEDLLHVKELLVTESWWDTIDLLASHLVGILCQKYPELIESYIHSWVDSDNIWLNRSGLIFQLKYKDETDFDLMKSYILKLKHKEEFFIQKAIGWSLRQYSRFDPEGVTAFVQSHQFSKLAEKEAMRIILK